MRAGTWFLAVSTVGCTQTLPPWRLDHDRILAVRASPPHIEAQAGAVIDVLVSSEVAGPSVIAPASVTHVEGPPLDGLLQISNLDGVWSVEAADSETIAGARTALSLASDAPVPVRIGIAVDIDGAQMAALKTVYVGDSGENPVLGNVTIDGMAAADGIVAELGDEVALNAGVVDPEATAVDWFTSVGTLTDIDDPVATLRVDEVAEGWLALVVRDEHGGVAWGYWSLRSRR